MRLALPEIGRALGKNRVVIQFLWGARLPCPRERAFGSRQNGMIEAVCQDPGPREWRSRRYGVILAA
jgi:hypothetical protein